jgi:uncharacterized repeat protein (TIGR01451 family)
MFEGNSVKAENSHIEKNSIRKVLGLLMGLGISLSSPAFAYSPGKDGVGTVTTANTVINTYYTVTAGLTAGGSTVPLSSVTGLSVGDVLMLYQAQGATITTTNSAAYGAVTALNNAGRYELVSIVSIAANTVTINTDCSAGLRYSYTNGLTQAIRVPQYTSLTVSGAGSITSTAWNGTTGGVVAAIVQNTASIGGAGITVAGQGFRGGVLDNVTTAAGTDVTLFVGASNADGGEKGESIAGFQTQYDALGGRYGRGAPANGGGGGDAHNGGGGGGANGNNGVAWTGSGIPSLAGTGSSVANWTAAWNLEGAGFATSTSSGGGRGGYTYGSANQDAVTVAPGTASWGGNSRRQRGGLGGRPMTNDVTGRLFFGGGGGAGDANNTAGSSGAAGGGIVLLIANTINGGGTINANGLTAGNSTPAHNDAPGGGGGGGSIVLSGTVGALTLNAAGGNGGNQLITGAESEGPGGGGGGGFIATSGGTASIVGGVGGTTGSSSVTEFIVNGATNAATGNTTTGPALASLPICPNPITNFSITKTNGVVLPATLTSGQVTTYTLVVSNNGPSTVIGALLQDPAATGLTITAVTCPSFTGTTSLPVPANVTVANLTGAGIPMPSMASGSTITCNVTATVTATGF